MIKILSLCAALLAPESTGLDPHGRALHLKLDADYNPHTFREHNNGAMVLLLGGPKLKITFTPYGENTYFVKIQ